MNININNIANDFDYASLNIPTMDKDGFISERDEVWQNDKGRARLRDFLIDTNILQSYGFCFSIIFALIISWSYRHPTMNSYFLQ